MAEYGSYDPGTPPPPAGGPVPNNKMALTAAIAAGVAWIVGGLASCGLSFIPFVNFVTFCTWPIFIIGNIVAVVTGFIGRNQIQQSNGTEGGSGLAMTGIVLGAIGLGLLLLGVCAIVLLALMGPAVGEVFSSVIEGI